MTTFVLVHGAWHGPWAWDRLTPFLHQAGARTITPALTLDGDIGLHAHVQELLTALDAVADMFGLAPEPFVHAIQAAARTGAGNQVPAPAPAMFGVTDPDDARWLSARMRPQPLRTFTETTRLSGAVDRIPGTGIYCRPRTYAFDQFAAAIGYRTIVLDGPHDVMLTHPQALARLLLEAHAFQFNNEKLQD
ncbi:alpha/beta hydrolase [Streptosporangium canum]|uniref:alpha/beta hydrolase n=1 Tax=Streptosporangium canum TaxID=324952 RepID=UPI003443E909